MRYKVHFKNLEDSIKYIDDKNNLVKDSVVKLKKYHNELKWESTNREIFDTNFNELIETMNKLLTKTDDLMNLLKTKYNLFEEVYKNDIKNISSEPEELNENDLV